VNAALPGLMKIPMVEKQPGSVPNTARAVSKSVEGPRRSMPDGPHGRCLEPRQWLTLSCPGRGEIRHRHRTGGRRRDFAQMRLSEPQRTASTDGCRW
jgi:hypothetical protein